MSRHIEDYTEKAPCGITIRYTVNQDDFITYNDINGRGKGNLSTACTRCTWRGICKPTPPKTFQEFKFEMNLIFSVEQMEILNASYRRAKKQGFNGEIIEYVEHLANIGACTTLLEIAKNV